MNIARCIKLRTYKSLQRLKIKLPVFNIINYNEYFNMLCIMGKVNTRDIENLIDLLDKNIKNMLYIDKVEEIHWFINFNLLKRKYAKNLSVTYKSKLVILEESYRVLVYSVRKEKKHTYLENYLETMTLDEIEESLEIYAKMIDKQDDYLIVDNFLCLNAYLNNKGVRTKTSRHKKVVDLYISYTKGYYNLMH